MTPPVTAEIPPGWLRNAVLTVADMTRADTLAAAEGGGGFALMLAAGRAVAAAVQREFPQARGFDILCGPGNNGGDGYVAAEELRRQGRDAVVFALAEPAGEDAKRAASAFTGRVRPLGEFTPDPARIAVDALFGAGLSRPLDGDAASVAQAVEAAGAPVAAVDVPSGIQGDSGRPLGASFHARLTVTFARLKPAHLLHPGRRLCGKIVLVDIGITDEVITQLAPRTFANDPSLWSGLYPWPEPDTHKYKRGHLAICSGPFAMTGAARLSAAAGARAGAGAVTLLSPGAALAANAAHLTAIMLRRVDTVEDLEAFLESSRARALALGPGFGDLEKARAFALAILKQGAEEKISLALDADGITAFKGNPEALFEAARGPSPCLVITPHEGEFARLFPDLAADTSLSKIERTRRAAVRAGAVIVLKGPDSVLAEPAGRVVLNTNATPFLATAGSGDVLTGLCGGLLAQDMPAFEAACAAVWIHAEAGRRFGPGLTADDLANALLPVLRELAPVDLP